MSFKNPLNEINGVNGDPQPGIPDISYFFDQSIDLECRREWLIRFRDSQTQGVTTAPR